VVGIERLESNLSARAALLLFVACAHPPAQESPSDVLAVTELAARYALEYEVPAVLREGSPICLTVDGQAPLPQVLSRLSRGGAQVSAGASACSGPRAVLLEVSGVVVSGDTAIARAGVRLGPSGVLDFRRVNAEWRVLRPQGQVGAGPVLTLPLRP
jgi:hypothetical protein